MVITKGLKNGVLPTIATSPVPPRVPDPINPPQMITDLNNQGGPQIMDPQNPGETIQDWV